MEITVCHAQAHIIKGLPVVERLSEWPVVDIVLGIIVMLHEVSDHVLTLALLA